MELLLYRKLSTRSKRAMRRPRGKFGQPYEYRPRGHLVKRLAQETGQPIEWVYDQIAKEREYLVNQLGATTPV